MILSQNGRVTIKIREKLYSHYLFRIHGSESVIGQFVHQTVEHRFRGLPVDSILTGRREIVRFLILFCYYLETHL